MTWKPYNKKIRYRPEVTHLPSKISNFYYCNVRAAMLAYYGLYDKDKFTLAKQSFNRIPSIQNRTKEHLLFNQEIYNSFT